MKSAAPSAIRTLPVPPEEREADPRREVSVLRRRVEELTRKLEMANLIFNHIHEGAMVTDLDGYITHFNEPYGRFLEVEPAAQVGRHTTEVVENTRMHLVAQSGRAEINMAQRIRGQEMVVQRIPIQKDGRVIAVYGQVMFKTVADVGRLANKLMLLESKVREYEEELSSLRSTRYTLGSIIGTSPATARLKAEAARAASNSLPVLITGESGTGKELFAQAIHAAGPRRRRPFIRLNCPAIPKDLFESEMFGYERGAFTGARSEGKPGKFELAKGGTVFLDEIGDLPPEMQPKLLRVLEEKEFERLGGTRIIKCDFRLIAATNQNLEEMLENRRFRKDLFYRLNVIPLNLPALRERREDILPIALHLLERLGEAAGQAYQLTPEAAGLLANHAWPGNVRELYNVLERVLSTLEGNVIHSPDLPFFLGRSAIRPSEGGHWSLRRVLMRAELEALRHALTLARGNKSRAADLLGIHRTLLYKKLHRHGLAEDGAGG